MEMEAELSRIIINEMSDQQIIVLKERHGHRSFPIVIGIEGVVTQVIYNYLFYSCAEIFNYIS